MILERDDLTTCAEGAKLAGVSKPTIRSWFFEGRIGGERIGDRIFVLKTDCEREGRERQGRQRRNSRTARAAEQR